MQVYMNTFYTTVNDHEVNQVLNMLGQDQSSVMIKMLLPVANTSTSELYPAIGDSATLAPAYWMLAGACARERGNEAGNRLCGGF